MNTLRIKLTGLRPLVLHNGLLADPLNPLVVKQKAITAKKNKKTDADNQELAWLEWYGGLYLNNKKEIVMPSDNIERCVQLGAQKQRLGKDFSAGVFMTEPEVKIYHPAIDGRKLTDLYEDPDGRFTLRKGVVIQKNRIIRVRPMIPTGWTLQCTLEYDETLVNERALKRALLDAGTYIGLGDWRPKFGRFTHEIL